MGSESLMWSDDERAWLGVICLDELQLDKLLLSLLLLWIKPGVFLQQIALRGNGQAF